MFGMVGYIVKWSTTTIVSKRLTYLKIILICSVYKKSAFLIYNLYSVKFLLQSLTPNQFLGNKRQSVRIWQIWWLFQQFMLKFFAIASIWDYYVATTMFHNICYCFQLVFLIVFSKFVFHVQVLQTLRAAVYSISPYCFEIWS